MTLFHSLFAEALDDATPYLLAGLAVTLGLRHLTQGERRSLRGIWFFVLLHLAFVIGAGALRWIESPAYPDVRLGALIFAAFAGVDMITAAIFTVILPRARMRAPRILQDVVFGAALLITIFVLARRLGFNLSGLIATSAVITAVIGFALQDTLGNVVGGLALQLDNSIEEGDWIKVGDLVGKVTQIRWRYTAVETRNWETAVIPNSVLVKGQVVVLGKRESAPLQWRRWIWFNVDFRVAPNEVIEKVNEALKLTPIPNVALEPAAHCILMDLHESYAKYAVRYWLTNLAVDDPTDSAVRTAIYFALKRAQISLSIPAQAVFVTEETEARRQEKDRRSLDARTAAIARVELFKNLSDAERVQLAQGLRHAPFAKGEVITHQGNEAHWLYLILDGEVAVRVESAGGLEREVARLSAGDFFGEMSLLTGAKRSATVVALCDVECFRLDKQVFHEIIRRRPELAEHLATVLARRNVELRAVKENLDQQAQALQLAATKNDLLGKIRDFFGLTDGAVRASGEHRALPASKAQ